VSPKPEPRTSPCDRDDAAKRLNHAQKYLEVAELVATDADVVDDDGFDSADAQSATNVAASLAVLAGIAASDAACCAALGRRPRGQDHREAVRVLVGIEPNGAEAAKNLDDLLGIKDGAHYGIITLSPDKLKRALRAASALIDFAVAVLRR
jgi:hypothetical protein